MAKSLAHYRELCTAVGGLMLAFAKLEGAVAAGLRLHLLFRLKKHKSADAFSLAAAIYGSLRLRVSQNITRRIMVEEGESQKSLALYDEMMAHIGHINGFRDKLAHQSLRLGSDRESGHWAISDMLVTRGLRNQLEYEFTTADVLDAVADLETAFRLIKHFLRNEGSNVRALRRLPAWRYKPTSLKLVRQKTETVAPKQKRPRRASQSK